MHHGPAKGRQSIVSFHQTTTMIDFHQTDLGGGLLECIQALVHEEGQQHISKGPRNSVALQQAVGEAQQTGILQRAAEQVVHERREYLQHIPVILQIFDMISAAASLGESCHVRAAEQVDVSGKKMSSSCL